MKKFALLLLPLLLAACSHAADASEDEVMETSDSAIETTESANITEQAVTVAGTTETSSDSSADTSTTASTSTGTKTKVELKKDAPAQKVAAPAPLVVNIVSSNFSFKPAQITAKVGQPVTVNIKNSGFHDFSIDALNVKVNLNNVPTGTVTFTPTKAGTFEFYCSVGSHRSMGMKGTLVVTQ